MHVNTSFAEKHVVFVNNVELR